MALEKKLVAGCIRKDNVINKVKTSEVKPYHLDNEQNSYLLKAILDLDSVGDVSASVLNDYINSDDSIDGEKKEALNHRVSNLESLDLTGVNFSLKKISEIAKKKEVVHLLNDVTESFEKNEDIDKVLDDVSKKVRTIQSSDVDYEIYNWMDSFGEREVERSKIEEQSEDNLTLGLNLYPFKDPYFKKGILPKQTTAIGGPTYSGKSVALINFIRLAAHPINGLNVLYVVSENRRIEAASRLDAVVLDKEYEKLYDDGLDRQGQDFFQNALSDGWGRIFLSKVTINNFDAATIETMLNEVQNKSGEEIDVLAIDSPDHQVPVENLNEWWRQKGKVYADNKKLAEDYDLINLTTLPLQRDAGEKKVKNEDVAGSIEIARYADNMIFYALGEADRKLNRGKLKVTKSRDGDVDNELIYMYFSKSMRLLPWDDVFNGAVNPEGEEGDSATDIKYKIENFKKKKDSEKYGETDFNVKS